MKNNNFYDRFGDQVATYRFKPTEYNRKKLINLCEIALIKLDKEPS